MPYFEFSNTWSISPPGSMIEILSHPTEKDGSVELAIFQEHRYAFFYWLKWTRDLKENESLVAPPSLVSFDWHQDLYAPGEKEKELLSKLNQEDDGDVALFSWATLNNNNDGHILSAAYLDLIGDIYICCRQGAGKPNFYEDWPFEDRNGKIHHIKRFETPEDLEKYLQEIDEKRIYFDIDLDYFVTDSPLHDEEKRFKHMKKKEIEDLLSVKNPLIQWIFKRLVGFTIATEPQHCGGLLKSNYLLDIINKTYFTPDLFTDDCDWKHLT